MTDYKAMIEEHSCKPNQGCGVMTICMCGVAEDMADEIERLREALREIAKTDIQTWAKTAFEKCDWSIVERIAEVDQQGIACRALAGVEARTALGEKE
jgi:hypothetical protein